MPHSREAKYYHHRLRDPRSFVKSSFRTVSVFATNYRGKWRKSGVLAITGYNPYKQKKEVQALRIPKEKYKEAYLQ